MQPVLIDGAELELERLVQLSMTSLLPFMVPSVPGELTRWE